MVRYVVNNLMIRRKNRIVELVLLNLLVEVRSNMYVLNRKILLESMIFVVINLELVVM